MDYKKKLIGLAQEHFNQRLLPELEKIVSDKDIQAVITGSVSFGYCDKYSDVEGKIILPEKYIKDARKIKGLTITKEGHKIEFQPTTIDEFCINPLLKSSSVEAWKGCSPFGLYAISKFIIMYDPQESMARLQKKVNGYYPKEFQKTQILNYWRAFLEDGVYNASRDMKRKNSFMFNLHMNNAMWNAMMLGFLFNKKYHPTHHQWLYHEFSGLRELVPKVRPVMEKMLKTADIAKRYGLLSKLIREFQNYARKKKLIAPEYLTDWAKIPWR